MAGLLGNWNYSVELPVVEHREEIVAALRGHQVIVMVSRVPNGANLTRCAPELDLPAGRKKLEALRKGDERKALLTGLLARKTTVNREWLGQRLGMGHPGSVSRMLGEVKKSETTKRLNELERL